VGKKTAKEVLEAEGSDMMDLAIRGGVSADDMMDEFKDDPGEGVLLGGEEGEAPDEGDEAIEEPVQAAKEPDPDAEPDWFEGLPDTARVEARKLHRAAEGQRHAIARERQRRQEADAERKDAISVAMELRRQMIGGQPRQQGQEQEEKPGDFIDLEIDDLGNARIPVSRLDAEIDRRVSERVRQGQQVNSRNMETGQYANQLLSEAGVTQATQQRMHEAIEFAGSSLKRLVDETGRVPRTLAEERQILTDAGIAAEVSKRYGGIRLTDVYDVYESVRDPHNYGHRLIDITQRYQEAWGTGKKASSTGPSPSRIGEHPGSLARKGAPSPSRGAENDDVLDEMAGMTMDDTIARISDPKRIKELFERWDAAEKQR